MRNSNQVCRICHVRLCLCVAFARMSEIIYSPAACRLGGSGPVVCLLYPLTWILKARSAEEKPATCLRAAPPQRVLLVRVPAALAAPSPNHPAPGASACGVVRECAWKGNRPRQTATLLGSAKAKVTVGAGRWAKRLRWRPRHNWRRPSRRRQPVHLLGWAASHDAGSRAIAWIRFRIWRPPQEHQWHEARASKRK